jgi:hypothetical protein
MRSPSRSVCPENLAVAKDEIKLSRKELPGIEMILRDL